jgi:hypothetical protein
VAISLVPIPVALNFANADALGMVFVQPHLAITQGHPFRIVESHRQVAATVFRNSIQYAFEATQGMPQVHFIIFPEFSLPFESFPAAENVLAACPANTVVIAGLEWITAEQYIGLLGSSSNPAAIKDKLPDPHLFVNCCVIWIKESDRLLRFLQPKLRPSPPEAATQVMYRGQDVFVFSTARPHPVSFALLICFDCIAATGETNMFDQIIDAVPDTGLNTSFNLQMLFVPQHNDEPEHASFLDFADRFLNRGGATLNTADSAVAFVNSASLKHGRADAGYGRSSLFYRSGRWQTIPADGPLVRVPGTYAVEGIINNRLMRARFREDGPSLHRFAFVLPWRVTREPGASRIPLTEAVVAKFTNDGELGPGRNTSAISKVFTDWWTDDLADTDARFKSTVDVIPEYSEARLHVCSVADADPERIGQVVDLLLLGFDAPCSRPKLNPDAWQLPISDWRRNDHGQAIVELAAGCSLLSLLGRVEMDRSSKVRTGTTSDLQFVVLDGNGRHSHVYLIQKYFEWLNSHPWGELVGKKVLVMLTRSSVVYLNTTNNVAEEIKDIGDLSAEDESALGAISPDLPTQQGAITEDSTRFFKHFRAVLAESLSQPTRPEAVDFLRERLGQAI